MDKKIERILKERNIVFRESTPLSIKELDKATKKDLHTLKSADSLYIKDTLTGKKETLELYNCFFDSMNIRQLKTLDHTIFINCVFQNTKIKNCAFESATFLSCTFNDSYILDTNLHNALFVNCSGVENLEMYNCNLNGVLFTTKVDIDSLEQNGCEVVDIQIMYESIPKEKPVIITTKNNMAKLPGKREEKNMTRDIIKGKDFKDITMGKDELHNKCFHNCKFTNVNLEENILLGATTDFIECTFSDMAFTGSYQKVAFDKSNFQNVVFDGEFSRCNFARCNFSDIELTQTAMFYTCNFDLSNAYEIFEEQQEQFTDVLFYKPIIEPKISDTKKDDKIISLLDELYEVMKSNDIDLKKKMMDLENVNEKEIAHKYIASLNDKEYIAFISEMSVLRVSNDQKNKTDFFDEINNDTTAII